MTVTTTRSDCVMTRWGEAVNSNGSAIFAGTGGIKSSNQMPLEDYQYVFISHFSSPLTWRCSGITPTNETINAALLWLVVLFCSYKYKSCSTLWLAEQELYPGKTKENEAALASYSRIAGGKIPPLLSNSESKVVLFRQIWKVIYMDTYIYLAMSPCVYPSIYLSICLFLPQCLSIYPLI